MAKVLCDDTLAVLSGCTVEGNCIRIGAGQLERKLYEEVNFALEGIGGKWNRKHRAHVFDESAEEIRDLLEGCIQTGIAEPLTRGAYFPTPAKLADRLIELADLRGKPPLSFLEPSAGGGNLIDALMSNSSRAQISGLDAIENDPKRYSLLAAKYADQKWLRVYPCDFLTWEPGQIYDRVIMNPPFIRLSDADHVQHAFGMLKPGGILVSIVGHSLTFRREEKAQGFRALVKTCGQFEEVPDKAFKESGTLTKTHIVVLKK